MWHARLHATPQIELQPDMRSQHARYQTGLADVALISPQINTPRVEGDSDFGDSPEMTTPPAGHSAAPSLFAEVGTVAALFWPL